MSNAAEEVEVAPRPKYDPNQPNVGWTEALGEHTTNPPAPRKTGETVFALGEEWTVSTLENRHRAQFEKWVRKGALRSITEMEEDGLLLETLQQYQGAFIGDRGAGHYNWDGRYCRNARQDVPGLRYLFYLLLKRCHPDVTEETATEVWKAETRQCSQAIGWALGNSATPVEKKKTGDKEEETLDGP